MAPKPHTNPARWKKPINEAQDSKAKAEERAAEKKAEAEKKTEKEADE